LHGVLDRRFRLNGLEGWGRTKTAFGCDIPGGRLLKLFKFEGLRDPPLPEPADPDPHVLDPEPDTDPESPEEVDIADDKYVGPWLVWHPPQDIAEPPSMEEVVVFPQLKSPFVEGGPSEPAGPGQYPGRGSGE